MGITSIQDACVGEAGELSNPDAFDTYRRAAAGRLLTCRVTGSLWWDRHLGLRQIDNLLARREAAGPPSRPARGTPLAGVWGRPPASVAGDAGALPCRRCAGCPPTRLHIPSRACRGSPLPRAWGCPPTSSLSPRVGGPGGPGGVPQSLPFCPQHRGAETAATASAGSAGPSLGGGYIRLHPGAARSPRRPP